ncbi:ATP-dependent helicase [soil metagenome]
MSRARRAPLADFSPATQAYFAAAMGEPTRAQALGWPPIARGESTLICAPTGSGKTLAAFLWALDRLAFPKGPAIPVPVTPSAHKAPKTRTQRTRRAQKEPKAPGTVRVLYVSPLKALAVDVERNLRAPLMGILEHAHARGETARDITVAVRTGDATQAERARILRHPPDILITTPESLYLMLTSQAAETLRGVETVIIDEIHQLVANKRGAHLFVSLERLEALRTITTPLQRIGLSATQKPLEEVARVLGGYSDDGQRPVTIVDAGARRDLVLQVSTPDIDMARLGDRDTGPGSGEADPSEPSTPASIWPHLHKRIVHDIESHRSTMVFVNSRRLAERLATSLNDVSLAQGGKELALAHHGSVAREKRAVIEDKLKRGELPAIVATSSLELGIDMGAVDLVVQIEAPPSIASGLQRVGRASHQVGGVPKGILLPKHRADLLACAAAAAGMREGDVEETRALENPLDVLAQQIVAICAASETPIDVEALVALIRRATPFRTLPRSLFDEVLDMLTGRYPSDEFAELRPRLHWDRVGGKLQARPGTKLLAVTNGGTIPDRGLYGVFLATGSETARAKRVGELDEEMVFELREGEVFLLGASSWRVEEITNDRVMVTPAAGLPGKMPFWHGDRVGRSKVFGERIGALTRAIEGKGAREFLAKDHGLDEAAIRNLIAYVAEQKSHTTVVPSDKTIVVERFIDDIGDVRICILSPFGARVHAPWAMAILAKLHETGTGDPDAVWSDDGIAIRMTATENELPLDALIPKGDDVTALVESSLAQSSLFAARFREAAARALLLPRRHPGRRSPLWAQRKRAHDLLSVTSRYPSFPIVLETYRECLRDVFDMPGLRDILSAIERRKIRVAQVDTRRPSPFAASLLFSFVANFIYDGDLPLAERRAQALGIDHEKLRELLGEAELRALFDDELLSTEEMRLQRIERPAENAEQLLDVLRAVGDLDANEIQARCKEASALATLEADRRVIQLRIAGETRFVAIEDGARYRDALGSSLPRGIPSALLEPVRTPLVDLVARYARTHAPFLGKEVAARWGIAETRIGDVLHTLEKDGRVLRGAFRPGGVGLEWVGKDVLASLRRRARAAARAEVEPVSPANYARFLLAWQNVGTKDRTSSRSEREGRLLDAIIQLEGAPLTASILETEIFPARVPGYERGDLDALLTSGQIVWAGVEPIGERDGRVALYLAEHEGWLTPTLQNTHIAEGDLPARIRAELEGSGALFFVDLVRRTGAFATYVEHALYDLLWAGEISNDTFDPIRRLTASTPSQQRRPVPPRLRFLHSATSTAPRGPQGRFALRATRLGEPTDPAKRALALAESLLLRWGVVVREAAGAESIHGGFGAVYGVLKALEDSGRVQRGYFVEGRGATQFALSEATDRLRALRSASIETEDAVLLSAVDPANPYGAVLPWPEGGRAEGEAKPRLARVPGAHVILVAGHLAAYAREGSLTTFLPPSDGERVAHLEAIARLLAAEVEGGKRRALGIERIDGVSARDSALGPYLSSAGFDRTHRGYMKRKSYEGTA